MIDFSIIIPVYNAEDYIVKCLDSVYSQSYNCNFEVITINDASTDKSLEKLYDYQRSQKDLIIINNLTNKKQTKTRLAGISIAKGKYIMHLDSDDWIVKDTFKFLKNCIDRYDPDIIAYNYIIEDKNRLKIKVNGIKNECLTTNKLSVIDHFKGASVTKLVKAKYVKDLISNDLSINHSEDLLYCLEILMRAEKIFLMPKELYVYFQNTTSVTQNAIDKTFLSDQLVVLDVLNRLNNKFNFHKIGIYNIIKNYFLKYVYLSISQIHFLAKKDFHYLSIFQSQIDKAMINIFLGKKDIIRLKISLNNKWLSILEVAIRIGLKQSLFILYKSLKKK